MRASRPACLCLVAAVILLGVLAAVAVEDVRAEPMPTGPWVDRIVWSEEVDSAAALERIEAGEADLLTFRLQSTAQGLEALRSPRVLTYRTTSTTCSLLFNPNEQQPGVPWNPFTDAKIREAMNWLIDRRHIIREVFDGLAEPQVTVFLPASPDYRREEGLIRELEADYGADFERARDVLAKRMEAHNASIGPSGYWEDEDGNRIDLRVYRRDEVTSLSMADYVAERLRELGFRVTVHRSPYEPIPFFGDPSIGAWHVYTEGWRQRNIIPWHDNAIWVFHDCVFEPFCARFGDPATYAPPADFNETSAALANQEYDSLEERQAWIRSLLPRTLNETNYRMWLLAPQDLYVASHRVEHVVLDAVEGPLTYYSLKSAKLLPGEPGVDPDTGVGGELQVLNFIAFNDAWNPWTEPDWAYDVVLRRAFGDPALWYHPQTGRWTDFRVTTTVDTRGPDGNFLLPPDALVWDLQRDANGTVVGDGDRFVTVGPDVRAPSRVTTRFPPSGNWHTGAPITVADAVHSLSAAYRRAFGDVSDRDPRAASADTKAFLADVLKGIVVDEEAGTIDAYLDYWHVDDRQIAAKGAMYLWAKDAPVPWEIQEAALQSIINDDTAVHEQTATFQDKIWLDLGRNPDSIAAVDAAFDEIAAENDGLGRVPAGMDPWISPSEASARYQAAQAFRNAYGHWYASNGPFVLETVDVRNRTTSMTAFREGYPYPPDRWDALAVEVPFDVTFDRFPSSLLGGKSAILPFSTTVDGERQDPQATRWFVRQQDTRGIPLAGVPVRVGEGAFEVQLLSSETVGLETGAYELFVVVQGTSGSRVSSFPFSVQSQVDFLASTFDAFADRLDALGDRLEGLRDRTDALGAALASLETLAVATVVLVAGAAAVSGASLALVLRRVRGDDP